MLTTCPHCRHVHAGPDFGWECIACPCPHTADCDCGHCETRSILHDPETMAAIEEGLRAVISGDCTSLAAFREMLDQPTATEPA